MNYYERHIGDYIKDTAHLSLLEHGIYGRLLDIYYTLEGPIPADRVMRLVSARSDEEQSAARDVLNEFFVREGESYRHERCDREISRYHQRAEHNRRVGKLGGRPRKDAERKPEENPPGYLREPEPNPPSNQKPVTNKTPLPPVGEGLPGFGRFWEAWPKHVRKVARQQCAAKWERKGCEAMADRLVASVEAHKASADWLKDDGAFIPAPLVWLNQNRWEAEIETTSGAGMVRAADDALAQQREAAAKAVRPPREVMERLRGVLKVVA